MKQTPELDRIQARMQPGILTMKGFLGHDPRPLAEILAGDLATVTAAGITHAQIADRLAAITRQGTDLMEREVTVEGRFQVTVRDDRGLLPSPFGGGRYAKGDTEVTDPRTGRTFRWNDLTLHLIRDHGFYNGRGSDYRLEPEELVAVFGIAPAAPGA